MVMISKTPRDVIITINETQLEQVQKFIKLGSILSSDARFNKDSDWKDRVQQREAITSRKTKS